MAVLSNLHLEILASELNGDASVKFEKIKMLSFRRRLTRYNVTADEIGTLIIDLKRLISDELYNFIRRCTSINHISIMCKWHIDNNPVEIIERMKNVVNLKKLIFPSDDTISTKEIVDLVSSCKTLEWIYIHSDKEMPEYPGIKESLGAEWVVRRHSAMNHN